MMLVENEKQKMQTFGFIFLSFFSFFVFRLETIFFRPQIISFYFLLRVALRF